MKLKIVACLLVSVLAYSCNDNDLEPQPDNIYYAQVTSDTTVTSVDHFYPHPWNGAPIPAPSDTVASIRLDVDNDGAADLEFTAKGWYLFESNSTPEANFKHSTGIKALNPGDSLVRYTDGFSIVDLPLGFSINDEVNYESEIFMKMVTQGLSFGCADGLVYFGFKIFRNGEYRYGWIQVDQTLYRITIKSYAYNLTPGNPINVGQTE